MRRIEAWAGVVVALAGCGGASSSSDGPRITATVRSTRFVTREHFLASGEMQIAGEPLAEAMGRDLGNFSRDHLPTDVYFDTGPNAQGPWIDLAGFSTGVESYEYSKQPMNAAAFELGAGTSMAYGPLLNPTGVSGKAATDGLAALVQKFAGESGALGRFLFEPGTYPSKPELVGVGGNPNSSGTGMGAENPLGWPGLWPTLHVFRSFDPTIDATGATNLLCSITSDDDPGATGALISADYECDATTLHLRDRAAQIEPVITPGADGFSTWKYGLWTINYLQAMHDSTEAAVDTVEESDLAKVGESGNKIVGSAEGEATAEGTFLGSSQIEGFQAALFLQQVDERAEDWLKKLSTTDGKTLSGFASIAAALGYDYEAPLRYFPGAIKVTETDEGSGFPRPAYAIDSTKSSLMDLVGVLLGYSTFYALTDENNTNVGGAESARVYFDGDPFAHDNGIADGEATLHDRALAMMRVALINLDRIHGDPASGVLVDDATLEGSAPTRGTTVSTASVAYTILGLRTALRSLGSQLELYSNNLPDSAVVATPLDALPTKHPSGTTFSARLSTILRAQGNLLYDHLTDASGRAYAGWDVATGKPTEQADTLDAHTAAIRGLFAMFFVTSDVKYRERAMAVYRRMSEVFYDEEARIYATGPAPMDEIEYTPLRFALLQSALRDVYEVVAMRPGGEALEPTLEIRLARLNKLALNGWDDRNGNRLVDWPDECVNVVGGLPRGGLQMAERSLTGETGSLEDQIHIGGSRTVTSDREHDCVPEIDDAHLPAALADSVVFRVARTR